MIIDRYSIVYIYRLVLFGNNFIVTYTNTQTAIIVQSTLMFRMLTHDQARGKNSLYLYVCHVVSTTAAWANAVTRPHGSADAPQLTLADYLITVRNKWLT